MHMDLLDWRSSEEGEGHRGDTWRHESESTVLLRRDLVGRSRGMGLDSDAWLLGWLLRASWLRHMWSMHVSLRKRSSYLRAYLHCDILS